MRTRSKLLLAALSASLLLGLAVGNASATRLKILNNTAGFRIVPIAHLTGAGNTISCKVTLEGTFHNSTFAKTARNLIGNITTAILENVGCTGGTAAFLPRTLPWNVQYVSFIGTLPVITSLKLRIIGLGFQITPTGSLTCLMITTETEPAIGIANLSEAGGGLQRFNTFTLEPGAPIRLTGEGGLCPLGGSGSFEGTGTTSVLGGTAKTVITLI